MTLRAFKKIVAEEYPESVPERFRKRICNVALLVEDEPSKAVRIAEGLSDSETLLGLYQGVPATARGEGYGIGGVMPDTVTLYRRPIEAMAGGDEREIRHVVRDTIWHEVAHHFGLDEEAVRRRERERKS